MMTPDAELLRRFVENRAEEAFRELVGRHLNFVYSAALRQVNGDTHLAQDVTQLVFTDLARKSDSLLGHRVLAGWLFVSTRYSAAKLIRSERRRQAREQEAFIMNDRFENNEAACDWARVRPVLDGALAKLSGVDRDAILLRFFEGRPLSEVGARLRVTENTARMRVERALDKLRSHLMRSGVSSTTGALAIVLANQGVIAAPAGLMMTVSGAALASAGTGGMAGVLMTFMSMSKLQLGILGAVAVSGTTAFVLQSQTNTALTREIAALQQENQSMMAKVAPPTAPAQVLSRDAESRNYDAELAALSEETAALQKQNAAIARAAPAAAGTSKLVQGQSATQLDRLPQATKRVQPEYPKELREAGITGEVLVEFVVDATGTVRDAIPVRSTDRGFEAAAVAAVEKWKFESGLKGGRPVNTRLQQSIAFTLSKDAIPSSTWF
jgi:RNA polymerase sigma factor (sigma-70 family)